MKIRRARNLVCLVFITLGVPGCDRVSGPAGESARGGTNYGEDRIGYMNASAQTEESTQGPTASNGSIPLYSGDYAFESVGRPDPDGPCADCANSGADAGPAMDAELPDAELPDSDIDGNVDGQLPEADTGAETLEPEAGVETTDGAPVDDGEQPEAELVQENPYFSTAEEPVSTFSIDVDTASYTLSRGYINHGQLPPPESVRIEEFVNYFHFHYAQPKREDPFTVYTEMAACPWNPDHNLIMLGVQGQEVAFQDQPPANLVFLIDVSGSMSGENKLPLLKKAFRMLVRQLRPQDRISIVTYAGHESVVLNGVAGNQQEAILEALDGLESGGSTNGSGGIQKAYEIALEQYIEGGNNRVLLATDGDFNVGITDREELVSFISTKRDSGVFLSAYGFGGAWGSGYDGNYQDVQMEQLADNGNGVYFYIDGPEEARRAFLYAVSGSLLTVAKDVKLQVEFNPAHIAGYRLIGYENRVLANNDFSNDAVDAGELGAGMSVTAFFEVIPAGSAEEIPLPLPGTLPEVEGAPEGGPAEDSTAQPEFAAVTGHDLMEVRIRYTNRDADESQLIVERFDDTMVGPEPSLKFLFGAGVSEFAMGLRGSQYLTPRAADQLLEQVRRAEVIDREGAVTEFMTLIQAAATLGVF